MFQHKLKAVNVAKWAHQVKARKRKAEAKLLQLEQKKARKKQRQRDVTTDGPPSMEKKEEEPGIQ